MTHVSAGNGSLVDGLDKSSRTTATPARHIADTSCGFLSCMGPLLIRPLLCLALAWALFAAPQAAAKPPGRPPFANAQAVLKWINGYRAKPEPERLPDAVHTLAALAVFRDLESSGVYIGFMAGVLSETPTKAQSLVLRMFPMAPEDQVVIVRAIAYSGLENWKDLLRAVAERMPARQVLIARHLDDKLPTLEKLALEGPREPG